MLKDRVIRTTFIISLVGHGLFLAMPSFNINAPKVERPKELTLQIEIEKPSILPKIERMGEEKRLEEVVSDSSNPLKLEPEPETLSAKVVMEEPVEESKVPEEKVAPAPVYEGKVEVINPAQEAMLRYQDIVKQRIEEVKEYPEWAREQGVEGIIHLKFTISSDGRSREIKLVHSSGSKILDREAVDTIERASPFPPLPKEIARSSIQMEVSLVFTLEEYD